MTSADGLSETQLEESPLYVVTNRRGLALGGRKWHVAAHKPSGYGIRALCGITWNEHEFRTHGPGIAGPLCKTCKRRRDA